MKGKFKRFSFVAVLFAVLLSFAGCAKVAEKVNEVLEEGSKVIEEQKEKGSKKEDKKDSGGNKKGESEKGGDASELDPDGSYTSKEDVALYIHTYG